MNEKFVEFFKNPTMYVKTLLRKCLDDKWYNGSNVALYDPCSFCTDVTFRMSYQSCENCFCPIEICNDKGHGGFIGILQCKYEHRGRTLISHLQKEDIGKMRSLFKARIEGVDCL